MTKDKFKKVKAGAQYIGVFPLEFAEDQTSDDAAIPTTIQLIPIGQWDHDMYGPIMITAGDIREFAQNFNAKIRKGVYITAGHEGFQELPANGWVTEVETRDNGLWGKVEWNELGQETLSDKQFKFFSPEFYRDYEDPQTHQLYRNVLTGGALTKSPYFKELEAIVFSEKALKNNFTSNNNNDMDLTELVAKDITTLTDEEKAFIKEHAAELTEEQKSALTSIVDEVETEEAKEAREEAKPEAGADAAAEVAAKNAADAEAEAAKATADANEAAGLNADGSAKIEASEKVMISAGELGLLRKKANEGAQAYAELEKQRLDTAVSSLVFSESNKVGRFLPKSADSLRTFMATLNADQRKQFSTLMAAVPKSEMFSEVGADGAATDGTAIAEVESKVDAKMKANDKLSYSDALKQVMSETKGLEERYDSELPSARKKQA